MNPSNFTKHRRRADANQAEVVAALRAAGYAVADLHRVGEDFPDLLAAHLSDGLNILVEVKQPGKKLTRGQKVFFDAWPGLKCIAEGGDEAVDLLAHIRADSDVKAGVRNWWRKKS